MKKIILVLFITLISIFSVGCNKDTDENLAIVVTKQNNKLYIHNLQGTRNDDNKFTTLDLVDNVIPSYIVEANKLEIKTGDQILFIGNGWGGWHNVSKIIVVSHDNPISTN